MGGTAALGPHAARRTMPSAGRAMGTDGPSGSPPAATGTIERCAGFRHQRRYRGLPVAERTRQATMGPSKQILVGEPRDGLVAPGDGDELRVVDRWQHSLELQCPDAELAGGPAHDALLGRGEVEA